MQTHYRRQYFSADVTTRNISRYGPMSAGGSTPSQRRTAWRETRATGSTDQSTACLSSGHFLCEVGNGCAQCWWEARCWHSLLGIMHLFYLLLMSCPRHQISTFETWCVNPVSPKVNGPAFFLFFCKCFLWDTWSWNKKIIVSNHLFIILGETLTSGEVWGFWEITRVRWKLPIKM